MPACFPCTHGIFAALGGTDQGRRSEGLNLDFKNPHTVEDHHGDPGELLAKLEAAEREAAALYFANELITPESFHTLPRVA